MRVIWMGAALAGLVAAAAACSETDEPELQPGCTDGDTAACACTDGEPGVSTCDGGAWSACDCGGNTGGTGGTAGSGGSGGTAGTGGSGGSGGTGGAAGSGGTGGTAGSGGSGGSTPEPTCTQVPDCEPDRDGPISRVCTLDGCVDAGLRDDTGLLRGTVEIYGFVDPVRLPMTSIRSYAVEVFAGVTNVSAPLDCATLLATAGRSDPAWSTVHRSTGDIPTPREQIPVLAPALPANDASTPFVAWVAFYGGRRDTSGKPTGSVIAEGCASGIVVPAGDFAEDEDHVYSTVMEAPGAH